MVPLLMSVSEDDHRKPSHSAALCTTVLLHEAMLRFTVMYNQFVYRFPTISLLTSISLWAETAIKMFDFRKGQTLCKILQLGHSGREIAQPANRYTALTYLLLSKSQFLWLILKQAVGCLHSRREQRCHLTGLLFLTWYIPMMPF